MTKVTAEFIASAKAHNKRRALLDAIKAEGDDVSEVIKAIQNGGDLNHVIEGSLPLQWAIHLGKFERFKLLSEAQPRGGEVANLYATVESGTSKTKMSLLHYAAAKGLSKFVRYLYVERKMDATIPDEHIRRLLPIHHAARGGNCATLDILNDQQQAITAVTGNGDFCIHIAAMLGKIKMVQHLVKLGADYSCRNNDGRTPLHCAVMNHRLEMVAFLLKENVSKKDVDSLGRNSYLLAVAADDSEMVKMLVHPENDFTASDFEGIGAMHIAGQKNNVKMMQFLKSCDVLTFVASDKKGRMPIHFVAEHDALEAFNFILAELHNELSASLAKHYKRDALESAIMIELHQILMNWQDENGDTVIEYSLRFKAKKILNRLVELGVKFERSNKFGCTPMHQMVERGDVEMLRFLISQNVGWIQPNSAGKRPVQVAFEQENLSVLEVFRDATNFNFKARDEDGMMLIHWACFAGQRKNINWLLQNNFGALTDIDNHGRNCLFHAARGDRDELILYLVNAQKMSLKTLCSKQLTVMHHAVFKSAVKAILVLKELKVSLEIRGRNGMLPFHLACRSGLSNMVDFLVQQGVNKDACNNLARNAWFYAAAGCTNEETFKTMERYHVALEGVLDKDQMSPLHHAASAGNIIAVKFFLEKKLSYIAVDSQGETPLLKAQKNCKKCQTEQREKLKRPEYTNGDNKKLNEELEKLTVKILDYLEVQEYLKTYEHKLAQQEESREARTAKVAVAEKRERKEDAQEVQEFRIVKPKMAKRVQAEEVQAEVTDSSKQVVESDVSVTEPRLRF
ncbi:MAG: ankyrin repeat domain-containing protein [Pseudomonadota bacterium]|nr:ankyrin repeat domain-containing protein [Pseudomonadota bacterium]